MKTYIHCTEMLRHRLTLILIFIDLAWLSTRASNYIAPANDSSRPDRLLLPPPNHYPIRLLRSATDHLVANAPHDIMFRTTHDHGQLMLHGTHYYTLLIVYPTHLLCM
ncbi:MAG: hypothetical protein ACI392_01375 [Paludibacteraceae bacterium]